MNKLVLLPAMLLTACTSYPESFSRDVAVNHQPAAGREEDYVHIRDLRREPVRTRLSNR